MLPACLLSIILASAAGPFPAGKTIRRVEVRGVQRVPAATVLHYISAQPDNSVESLTTAQDLRKLHDLGLFREVQVRSHPVDDGRVDVIYEVRENPWIDSFEIIAGSNALQGRIGRRLKEAGLELRPAEPYRPSQGKRIEAEVRSLLREEKHPQSEVLLHARESEGRVNMRLVVKAGPRLEIGAVAFEGNESIPDDVLRRQLEITRVRHFWELGSRAGTYDPVQMRHDLNRVRQHYTSQGYASVRIGEPEAVAQEIDEDEPRICISVPIAEGPRYRLESIAVEGDAGAAAAEIDVIVRAVQTPAWFDRSLLESTREKIAQALGHHGYALGQVELAQETDDCERTVRAQYSITAGLPVFIGKIYFTGNAKLKEALLRRHLLVQEGGMFDARALDESIERLNRSGLVSQMDRGDLKLEVDSFDNTIDITFQIREMDRHGIFGAGGSGGIGGPYVGFIYRAINLLGLGEELALEMNGGAAQSNLLLDVVGRRVFGSPFTLALSAFHRATDFNVASIVPDTGDLISLLRRKSNGIGLSGAYEINDRAGVGLGIHHERVSTAISQASLETSSLGRTGLAPSLLLDLTRGAGNRTRGYQFLFSQNWSGNSTLTRIRSAAHSINIHAYRSDPCTSGRNSFAFRLQGRLVHSLDKSPVEYDQRFFSGDEIVRGFRRGGLSPWLALSPDDPDTIRPAGADRLLALSSEYRIPLSARLSGTGFFDLGWSRLSPSQEPAADLIAATNGLLRGSLGGELRLQLPLLNQPGRMIFAWNPLRLDKIVSAGSRPLRLADPRGVVRFALGGVF